MLEKSNYDDTRKLYYRSHFSTPWDCYNILSRSSMYRYTSNVGFEEADQAYQALLGSSKLIQTLLNTSKVVSSSSQNLKVVVSISKYLKSYSKHLLSASRLLNIRNFLEPLGMQNCRSTQSYRWTVMLFLIWFINAFYFHQCFYMKLLY